jgi:hypothetical protein
MTSYWRYSPEEWMTVHFTKLFGNYSIKGRNSAARIVLFLYVKDHLMEEEYQEKLNNYVMTLWCS